MRKFQQDPSSSTRDLAQRVFVEFEMARRDLFITLVFTNPRLQRIPGTNERCWSLTPPSTSGSLVHVVAVTQAFAKQHGGILMTFSSKPTAIQEDAGTTCERQFVELLDRMNDFENVMGQVKKIIIAIEYCSSSQHPWSCRKLPQSLFSTEEPLLQLSVNPDRVTRRSEEVPTISQSLAKTGSM
ncbi:hypothetical protein BGZ67_009523 [Mortierella alpina]|nr:hypothetical protein BGZ67_009523 [Mortierella alpina]